MISNALTSAQSGIAASLEKVNVHAHNIANINTDGYKSVEVKLEEEFQKSVNAESKDESERNRINEISLNRNIEEIERSDVDLAKEVVGSMIAQRGYEANIKVFETADYMNKQVIDLFS